jgi:hypothetical protein
MKNTTRKNTTLTKVYCLPAKREERQALAYGAGRTASNYLLTVRLGCCRLSEANYGAATAEGANCGFLNSKINVNGVNCINQ